MKKAAQDPINYTAIADASLRGAIGPILSEMLRRGWELGLSDFDVFITFHPAAFGVRMSEGLRKILVARYGADPINIQLSDGFQELRVAADGITVWLSFGGKLEEIEVLYRAMTVFYIPAAQFLLVFEGVGSGGPRNPPPAPRTGSNDKVVDLAAFRGARGALDD